MEASSNAALYAMLSNEELAEQSDTWRYAAEEARRRGQYGLAKFSERMSHAAYEALVIRQAEEAARANQGEQLRFTEREYRHVFEPGA